MHRPNYARILKRDAKLLSMALEQLSKSFLSPEDKKFLRTFTASEASEILGVTPGYLRKQHHEGKLPEIAPGPSNKRAYTANDLHEIRLALAGNPRVEHHYLPGRRPGDDLQVWSLINFKGGSSKTTTAIHLAQRYALRGYRVLVVDLDPQASLTTYFGLMPEIEFMDGGTIYEAIRYDAAGEPSLPMRDVVRKTYFTNLDLAPAGIVLQEFETETANAIKRGDSQIFFYRLRDAIMQVEADYDLVIIDCPPQLGFLTMGALCASTSVAMTIIPERIDCASATQFLHMASGILDVLAEHGVTADFDNFAYLLTRFDTSIAAQQDLALWLRDLLGDRVISTPFVKSSAVSEAGLSQKTVFEVDLTTVKNRKTYERALESAIGVANDVEKMIQTAWGREVQK